MSQGRHVAAPGLNGRKRRGDPPLTEPADPGPPPTPRQDAGVLIGTPTLNPRGVFLAPGSHVPLAVFTYCTLPRNLLPSPSTPPLYAGSLSSALRRFSALPFTLFSSLFVSQPLSIFP